MTKLQIITLPDSRLRTKSQRVRHIDRQLQEIVQQMQKLTLEWEKNRQHEVGIAMAAIQIGQPLRLIIIRQDTDNREDPQFEVLLNPKVIQTKGELEAAPEGCLSIPDVYAHVPRYPQIKVAAQTLDGREVRIKAKGFLARILQHEIDHLEGKLFIDHIQDDAYYKITTAGEYVKLTSDEIKQYRFLRRR